MTDKCYDEGIIQAFLDGELAHETSQQVTRHLAACEVCAFMLAEAEEETALAFSALEREFDTLVPTTRLWAKINDSIVEERKQTSVWQRLLSLVSVNLMSPSMAVAAGILMIFGIFAVILNVNNYSETNDMAAGKSVINSAPIKQSAPVSDENRHETLPPSADYAAAGKKTSVQKSPVQLASMRENTAPRSVKKQFNSNINNNKFVKNYSSETDNQTSKVVDADYLPGEESYVKTIASLSQTVETQKDTALRPSARISFERDLAVVDDAIKKMKREVSRNPKNESAKQVLYSSYQNKIDLLSSVADKTELMASLK